MLDNALDQFIENDAFDYFIYSTADIIVPNNLFLKLSKIKEDNFIAFIFPNTHIINGIVKNNYWPHYGIDLIVFKKYLKKKQLNLEILLKVITNMIGA